MDKTANENTTHYSKKKYEKDVLKLKIKLWFLKFNSIGDRKSAKKLMVGLKLFGNSCRAFSQNHQVILYNSIKEISLMLISIMNSMVKKQLVYLMQTTL